MPARSSRAASDASADLEKSSTRRAEVRTERVVFREHTLHVIVAEHHPQAGVWFTEHGRRRANSIVNRIRITASFRGEEHRALDHNQHSRLNSKVARLDPGRYQTREPPINGRKT